MASIDRGSELVLTSTGRKKVESMRGEGIEFAFLSALYNSGGMTVGEVQAQVRIMNPMKAIGLAKVLESKGYVQHITSSEHSPS